MLKTRVCTGAETLLREVKVASWALELIFLFMHPHTFDFFYISLTLISGSACWSHLAHSFLLKNLLSVGSFNPAWACLSELTCILLLAEQFSNLSKLCRILRLSCSSSCCSPTYNKPPLPAADHGKHRNGTELGSCSVCSPTHHWQCSLAVIVPQGLPLLTSQQQKSVKFRFLHIPKPCYTHVPVNQVGAAQIFVALQCSQKAPALPRGSVWMWGSWRLVAWILTFFLM